MALALVAGAFACLGAAAKVAPALDALNSFAPFTLAAALVCGGLAARRRRGRGLALVAAAAGAFGAAPRLYAEYARAIPAAPAGHLRVLTYNVWRDNTAPDETVAAILAAKADIVLLQETGGTIAQALAPLFAAYRYHSDCNAACDTIILSRLPMLASDWRVRDTRGRRVGPSLVWARLQPSTGPPFPVVAIHLPRARDGQALGTARERLAAVMPAFDRDALILAGDINLTPWSYALAEQDRAFVPLTRLTRATATYPARLGGWPWPIALLPIDHVYAGPAWRLVRTERLEPGGSDHRGIVVTLASAL